MDYEQVGRELLVALRGDRSQVAWSRRLGYRSNVWRWLGAKTQPRLPDSLRVVEAASLRMVDWIGSLVDPATMPSLASAWAQLEARRKGAAQRDLERIRELHLRYFHELRALLAESEPGERVAVANVQLFALDEPGPDG